MSGRKVVGAAVSYSNFRRQIKAQVAADMQLIASKLLVDSVESSLEINSDVTSEMDNGAKFNLMCDDSDPLANVPVWQCTNDQCGDHQGEMNTDELQSLSCDSDDSQDSNVDLFDFPLNN